MITRQPRASETEAQQKAREFAANLAALPADVREALAKRFKE